MRTDWDRAVRGIAVNQQQETNTPTCGTWPASEEAIRYAGWPGVSSTSSWSSVTRGWFCGQAHTYYVKRLAQEAAWI